MPPGRGGGGRGYGGRGRGGGRGNSLHTGGGGRGRGRGTTWGDNAKSKLELDEEAGELEGALGMENFIQGPPRLGWLMNISTVSGRPLSLVELRPPCPQRLIWQVVSVVFPQGLLRDRETGQALSCINCYFMCQVRRIISRRNIERESLIQTLTPPGMTH